MPPKRKCARCDKLTLSFACEFLGRDIVRVVNEGRFFAPRQRREHFIETGATHTEQTFGLFGDIDAIDMRGQRPAPRSVERGGAGEITLDHRGRVSDQPGTISGRERGRRGQDEGLEAKRGRALERRYSVIFAGYFKEELARLQPLIDDGLVRVEPDRIEATSRGRLLLRNIAMCFDRYLDNPRAPVTFSRAI